MNKSTVTVENIRVSFFSDPDQILNQICDQLFDL